MLAPRLHKVAPLILCALLAFADRAPLDAVILIEESPRTRTQLIDIPFTEGDRIAIMTFNSKASLKQGFTSEADRLARAIRPPKVAIGAWSKAAPRIHAFDAILAANELFSSASSPGRRRAIILLFSTDDDRSKATVNDVRAALLKTGARLAVAAIEGAEPLPTDDRVIQRRPLPEQTLDTLHQLAVITQVHSWNLDRLIEFLTQ